MGTGTNKIVMSRIEVADLICPQMPPVFSEASDEPLVIEEYVPAVSGDHPTFVGPDSFQVPIIDLRTSGLVAIDDRDATAPLSLSLDEIATMNAIAEANDAHLHSTVVVEHVVESATKYRNAPTSLGVAPLEPATTVRAPFVVDTMVPRHSSLGGMTPPHEPRLVAERARERTAILAVDPHAGVRRGGPWQALVAVATSLRRARWWRHRKPSPVKPVAR